MMFSFRRPIGKKDGMGPQVGRERRGSRVTVLRGWPVVLLGALSTGCAARSPQDRGTLSESLRSKTGHPLRPAEGDNLGSLPQGVDLEDGLTEDEAVATALWNNAALEATLAELGLVRADLVEAGLIKNPVFSLLFPWGPKQLEFTLTWPIETLWQRPRKVAAAKLDVERTAARLVASGLDLARDVKMAHADMVQAQERVVLLEESRAVRADLARIATVRLRVGDLSPLEAASADIDAARADDDAARASREEEAARERLRTLLGLAASGPPLAARATPPPVADVPALADLLLAASASRPEVRAAELGIEAAGKRAGLARSDVLALSALLDANGSGKEGFEMGPGLALELPLFGRNRGRLTRAEAELDLETRRYLATRERIALEVRQARIAVLAARDSLTLWRARVIPSFEESLSRVEKAQQVGEASRLEVLAARRSLLAARLQGAVTACLLSQAEADLEREVGTALSSPWPLPERSEAHP